MQSVNILSSVIAVAAGEAAEGDGEAVEGDEGSSLYLLLQCAFGAFTPSLLLVPPTTGAGTNVGIDG